MCGVSFSITADAEHNVKHVRLMVPQIPATQQTMQICMVLRLSLSEKQYTIYIYIEMVILVVGNAETIHLAYIHRCR